MAGTEPRIRRDYKLDRSLTKRRAGPRRPLPDAYVHTRVTSRDGVARDRVVGMATRVLFRTSQINAFKYTIRRYSLTL